MTFLYLSQRKVLFFEIFFEIRSLYESLRKINYTNPPASLFHLFKEIINEKEKKKQNSLEKL